MFSTKKFGGKNCKKNCKKGNNKITSAFASFEGLFSPQNSLFFLFYGASILIQVFFKILMLSFGGKSAFYKADFGGNFFFKFYFHLY